MTAWSEHTIARALGRDLFQRKFLILVPNCYWTGHEADLLCVTPDLRLVDVEIKISRSDLKADAKKDKWWFNKSWYSTKTIRNQWPPKVWKHYYVFPKDLWVPDLLGFLGSEKSGVLLIHGKHGIPRLEVIRRAQANRDAQRIDATQAIDLARLGNLRMWDALARSASEGRNKRVVIR